MFRPMLLVVLFAVVCAYAVPAPLGEPASLPSTVSDQSISVTESKGGQNKDLEADATSYNLGYSYNYGARVPYGYNYNGLGWSGYSRTYPLGHYSHYRTPYWSPYNTWY